MYVTIDRFEGEFAVVEMNDKNMVNIPKCLVPTAKEGDIISITIDKEKTSDVKEEINKLMNKLFED